MTDETRPRPKKEAGRITQLLDLAYGEDRFEKGPVDIAHVATSFSKDIAPESPIHEVSDLDIPGCMGALLYSDNVPRQWGIVCHVGQSSGRRAYTIAHEFGHYMLHRSLIEKDDGFDGGIYCDEDSILRRAGEGIEREADEFAAALLMPLHDFRRQLPAKDRADFDMLGNAATRYGVSLTAAILRWLEYTETRAIMLVSNEGFGVWSKPSQAALRSGLYIKTKDVMYELPEQATAVRREYNDESQSGLLQPAGVWFREPAVEMCLRSDRYDQEITLLHFEDAGPHEQEESEFEDSYDRFVRGGQA